MFLDIENNEKACRMENVTCLQDVQRLINKIIPDDYFGNSKNRNAFGKIVERILTMSTHECVYKIFLVQGFDCDRIKWLIECSGGKKTTELLYLVIFVFLLLTFDMFLDIFFIGYTSYFLFLFFLLH